MHSSSSSTDQSGCIVVARAIHDGQTLELSLIRLDNDGNELPMGISPPIPSPQHFLFPAPLLPEFSIFLDKFSGGVTFIGITITGWLFHLRFPSPGAFYASTLPHDWASEHRVASLVESSSSAMSPQRGGSPLPPIRAKALVHIVDPTTVLVACEDGALIKLQRQSDEDEWRETMLRSTSFLKNFSKFFSRSSPSPAQQSVSVDTSLSANVASIQVVSIDTLVRDDASSIAFCISRDRKLRAWDLVTDSCVVTVDLPSALVSESDEITVTSLPPFGSRGASKPHVRVFRPDAQDESEYPLYLLVFVPTPLPTGSFFALYGVELAGAKSSTRAIATRSPVPPSHNSASGQGISQVALLWQKACDQETKGMAAELRDAIVMSSDEWALWTLWDAGGRSLIKQSIVHLVEEEQDGEETTVDSEDWNTTAYDPSTTYTPLRGSEIEALLSTAEQDDHSSPQSAASSFYLSRIMEAGRYSVSSLEWAVDVYAAALLDSLSSARLALPAALQADAASQSLAEQIALTVGSGVQLEIDPETGAVLHEEFKTAIRREWQRFIGLLEEADGQGRWPIEFVASSDDERWTTPLVLTRDRLAFTIHEDAVDALVAVAEGHCVGAAQRSGGSLTAVAQEISHENNDGQLARKRRRLAQHLNAANTGSEAREEDYGEAAISDLGEMSVALATVATALTSSLPAISVDAFARDTLQLVSQPLGSDINDAALDLWNAGLDAGLEELQEPALAVLTRLAESKVATVLPAEETVSEDIDWEKPALEPAFFALADLLMSSPSLNSKKDSLIWNRSLLRTEIASAFVADGAYQSLRNRTRLSKSLLLLALAIHAMSASEDDEAASVASSFERLPNLIVRLITVFHSLSLAVKLADLPLPPEESRSAVVLACKGTHEDDIAKELGLLNVSEQSRIAVAAPTSGLVHFCVAQEMLRTDSGDDREGAAASQMLAHAVSSTLQAMGISSSCDAREAIQLPTLGARQALLCHSLVSHGVPLACRLLANAFAETPASSYLSALALLQQGCFVEAAEAFSSSMAGILALSQRPIRQDQQLLAQLLPPSVLSGEYDSAEAVSDILLARYCRHVADLFEPFLAHSQIVAFVTKALRLARSTKSTEVQSPADARELYFRLFRSQLHLGDYAASYSTVMEMPSDVLRRDCLRMLISAMCETGHVSQLLEFNFAGLQAEVERNLSFKARNCDPTALPNFFHILYSYHVHRSDFKSAGAVMYQQAHRLGELQRIANGTSAASVYDNFLDLAVQQARSYLTAINALSLLDANNAWFADALNTGAMREYEEENLAPATMSARLHPSSSAKKLSSYIPSSHWQAGSKEIRIVQQDDVRREYRLVLSRLELVQMYPELASATMTLSATDIVSLLIRNEEYDKAFTAARGLDVDPCGIFAQLAVKCATSAFLQSYRKEVAEKELQAQDPEGTGVEANKMLDLLAGDYEAGQGSEAEEEEGGDWSAGWGFLRSSDRTSGWTGSLAERAWRYLKLNLEIEDARGPETVWRHRVIVLERLLALRRSDGGKLEVPLWLLGWFENEQPELLIKVYLKTDRVDEALQAAIRWVQKSNSEARTRKVTGGGAGAMLPQRYIAYVTLDSLMKRAIDPDERPVSATESAAATRALVDELKKVIGQRGEMMMSDWHEKRNVFEDRQRKAMQGESAMQWA